MRGKAYIYIAMYEREGIYIYILQCMREKAYIYIAMHEKEGISIYIYIAMYERGKKINIYIYIEQFLRTIIGVESSWIGC